MRNGENPASERGYIIGPDLSLPRKSQKHRRRMEAEKWKVDRGSVVFCETDLNGRGRGLASKTRRSKSGES